MEHSELNRMLTEQELAELVVTKDARRAAMFATMTGVNETLIEDGTTTGAEIYAGWKDINCYFPYGVKVLHVRVSPLQDDDKKLRITMRELDPAIMLEARARVSIGAEYQEKARIILEPTLISDTPASIIDRLRRGLSLPKA